MVLLDGHYCCAIIKRLVRLECDVVGNEHEFRLFCLCSYPFSYSGTCARQNLNRVTVTILAHRLHPAVTLMMANLMGWPLSLEVVLAGSRHFSAFLHDDRDVDGASQGSAGGRAEVGR